MRFETCNTFIQCKIGDFANIKSGRDQKTVACENGNYPIYGTGGIFGKANNYVYNKPTVCIGRKGTIDRPFYIDTPFWCVDTLFYSEINENILPKYVFYLFQTINWKYYDQSTGVPSLTSSVIESIKVVIPEKTEQEKIAKFLTLIDERIATQNKIIDKLESLIKGIRAKVFTRKAENYKRLKDLYIKGKAGGTPKSTINEYYDGEIPFLSIADISSQSKYITKTERYLSESGIENSSAWKVPENSLILSIYASVGLPCINKIELSTSQAMFAMVLEDEQMLNYLYHYLLFYKDTTLIKYLATGTQSNINADIVKEIKIPLYGVDTISKIDKLLQFSDEKIEQEKNMLLTLQRQKAYLLKNMFI